MRRNDALATLAELAASQHGAFTRRQAADLGLSRRQIQAIAIDPAVTEPIRGVLVFGAAPTTWRQRMMVATLSPPGFHAGFRAAGFLHELDGCREQPRPEIVGPRNARTVRGAATIVYRRPDGTSCTSVGTTPSRRPRWRR